MMMTNGNRPAENSARLQTGMSRSIAILILAMTFATSRGSAQSGVPCAGAQAGKVACLFSDVVTGAVRSVNPSFSLDPKLPLGTSVISTQLTSSLPMPAPASGYVFEYDPNLGTARAERQSYGPIFTQRAETIGLHKFSFGVSSETFVFDKIDGLDLHKLPGQLTVGDFSTSGQFNHDFRISQNIVSMIYGVHDRIDISAAIPFSTVDYGLSYSGTYKSANTNQTAFVSTGASHRSAAGLGDVNVQVKGTVIRGERFAVALGAMLRLPTGDEYNVLGSGAPGIRPFVAASFVYKKFSPHVNIGYLFNGKSVLAADSILSGEKRRIPSQFQYAAGVDAGVTARLTLAFDFLGFEAVHADRLQLYSPQPFTRESFNVSNGAAGFKVRVFGNVLLQASALFRLNDSGLRSRITPLVGMSYEF
jgi:hypothetical protein